MFELRLEGAIEFMGPLESALTIQIPALKKTCLPGSLEISLHCTEPDEARFTKILEKLSHILSEFEINKTFTSDLKVQVRHLDRAEPTTGSPRWTEPFRPIPGLTIYPWQAGMAPVHATDAIFLDPGSSFGTGKHPSTRLCLSLLRRIATQSDLYPWFPKGRVLDIGCGTGILSLFLAKMGADQIIGLEIDHQAAEAAARNVKLNGLTSRVTVCQGSWEEIPQEKFHLIVANLTASVLLNSGGKISDHIRRHGIVVAAGFQEPQIDMIQKFLRGRNLMAQEKITHKGWAALLLHAAI